MSLNENLIRHPYNRDTWSKQAVDFTDDPGRTKQADEEACNINNIMKRYTQRGILPFQRGDFQYGNFIDAPTYIESMQKISEAQEAFNSLPAALRSRFENDAAKFLEFVQDPGNADEMVELKLAQRIEKPAPRETPEPAPKETKKPEKPAEQ